MSGALQDKSEPLLTSQPHAPSDSTAVHSTAGHPTTIADAHGLVHTIGILLRNRPLLFVVAFGCLGGLLFGYDIGVMGAAHCLTRMTTAPVTLQPSPSSCLPPAPPFSVLLLLGGVIVLDGFRQQFGYPLLVQGVEDDASTSASLAWLVSVFPLCCAATAIVSGTLSDVLSRRYSVLLGAVLFTVGGAIQAFSSSHSTLLFGRVLGGFAIGILSTIIPIYNAELSAPDVRGIMNTLFQLAITIGILVAFAFNLLTRYAGDEGGWRWSLGMQSVLSAVLVVGIGMLPESPRWFMKKRREEEARAVLRRLRLVQPVEPAAVVEEEKAGAEGEASAVGDGLREGFFKPQPVHDSLDAEVEEIRASIWEEEAAGVAAWSDLIAPPMRLRLLYGCGVQAMQQLTYINAVMYYSSIIFSAVGINPLVATAVTGLVNVLATMFTISYVDRLGRIPLLLTGGAGMMLSALLVACVSSLSAPVTANAGVSVSGLLIVLLICSFVISFGAR